jgi:hypothetical protein
LWVAVGGAGTIETSLDGINWTVRSNSFGVGNAVRGIAYNGQSWVAAGYTGTIETSPDGITWTARSSGFGSNNIYGVACLSGSNTGLLSTGSPYNGSGAQLFGGGTQGIGAEVTAGTYGIGLKATGGAGNTAIQAIAGTNGVALQTQGSYTNLASGLYDIGSIGSPFHKVYLANEVTCSGITPMMGPLSVNGDLSITGKLAVNGSSYVSLYSSVSSTNGTIDVVWTNVGVDILSEMDTTKTFFTAKAAGVYLVTLDLLTANQAWTLNDQVIAIISKNNQSGFGGGSTWANRVFAPAQTQLLGVCISAAVKLAAGDTIKARYYCNHTGGVALDGTNSTMTITRIQ